MKYKWKYLPTYKMGRLPHTFRLESHMQFSVQFLSQSQEWIQKEWEIKANCMYVVRFMPVFITTPQKVAFAKVHKHLH